LIYEITYGGSGETDEVAANLTLRLWADEWPDPVDVPLDLTLLCDPDDGAHTKGSESISDRGRLFADGEFVVGEFERTCQFTIEEATPGVKGAEFEWHATVLAELGYDPDAPTFEPRIDVVRINEGTQRVE
jgi:hypothetical protein